MFDGQSLFTGYLWLLIMNFPIFDGPNMSRPSFPWLDAVACWSPKFESIWTLNQPTNLSWLANRPWFPISSPAPQPSWAPAVVVGPPPRRLFGAARHRAPCRWEAAPRASCSKEVLGWNMRIVGGGFVSGHFQIKHVISSLGKTGSGAKVI